MKTKIPDTHSHSIAIDGFKHTWFAKNLWKLAEEMKVFDYNVEDFKGFDQDMWFGDRLKPTINAVLEHQRRIQNADLSYPIIISDSGLIMDGIHRICRAKLEGLKSIKAVKFEKNPPADKVSKLA